MQNTQQSVGARAMTGGFTEAVFQSQSVFRVLMEALSRPGRLMPLDTACEPQAGHSTRPRCCWPSKSEADANQPSKSWPLSQISP